MAVFRQFAEAPVGAGSVGSSALSTLVVRITRLSSSQDSRPRGISSACLPYKPARCGLATRVAVSQIVQLAVEFHVQRPPQLAQHAALVSAYTDATSRHMVAARCCLLLSQEKINRLATALER